MSVMNQRLVPTAKWVAQPSASTAAPDPKRQRVEQPKQSVIADTAEVLSEIGGMPYDIFTDCVMVAVADEGYAQAEQGSDLAKSLEAIPGRYWAIGSFGGATCYRQEPTADDQPNNKQLFLHHWTKSGQQGWYISATLLHGKDDHLAWGPSRILGGSSEADGPFLFPTKLHVPFYSKKCNGDVSVVTAHEWFDRVNNDIMDDNDLLRSTLDDLSGEKGKGKGKGKKESPSGWMNRVVPLIAAVLDGRPESAKELSLAYAEYPLVKDMLKKYRASH